MTSTISKQEMRRNPLVEWLVVTVRFVQARRTAVLAALVALGLLAAAGYGFWWYQQRREDEASRALAGAHATLRGDQPGSPGNREDAMKRFREIAQQYGGTPSAEESQIALGNLQFEAGKMDDAVGSFEEYLTTYPRGRFRVMAGLGKAYAQEAKADLQGAAKTLSELLDRDKDDPLSGEAYMALARMYEGLKKPDEAMRVYGQVVERFSQTQWAQHALQRMSALKTK
ncbi:MAG: tetratricopeptide repeat protein [candidate division NC10 bacterium]|nr:tetratricopeptide repeat protein [candidate division NC10 bacterium]